LIPYRCAEKQD